ncbi:MAG: hypothetical protein ACJ73J_05185 [Actinomycetes bacterium]
MSTPRYAGRLTIAVGVLIALLVACTAAPRSDSSPSPAPSEPTATPSEVVRVARQYLLSSKDLPQLAGEYSTVDAQDLADEAAQPDLAAELKSDGFLGGAVRDLRGRSRDITGANSRVLVFSGPEGAQSLVTSVAADPDPFFGGPSVVRRFHVGSAKGVMIKPPMCACPGAYPVYVGLVADGPRMLWLQLTGPRASAAQVRRLLSNSSDMAG